MTASKHEASVRPGVNEPYLDPNLDVAQWVNRFEVESREIYEARAEIVRAVALRPGHRVADIGAGTGLFLEPFADAVGATGRLYELDISPKFVEHIRQRAARAGLTQVEARQCPEDSVNLPAGSIDIAFICDVYHHFEYPHSTMTSIRNALAPGGEVVLIDFERNPGQSRPWVLEHVRAGRDVFTKEIEAAGFRLLGETTVPGLRESYFLRFRRVEG
ncbi:MAG: methyltransferase domain-containing protein [Phycisphaerales bacterium]|nr:methyltransferase domain-containing protein [Phycisphaerales bacterium]